MLSLASNAPDFDLLSVDGKRYSLASFSLKPVLVVIFSCNHCPYAKDYEDRMIAIQRDYESKGVQVVAVNSNDEESYPEDSYPEMIKRAQAKGFNFPYLRDQTQKVVESYGSVCTPHVFVFDRERLLRYRGRIDDSRDPEKVKAPDLRNALDDLLASRGLRVSDTRPFGCSIKWMAT
jgi:peroxiredoxin